MLSGCISNISDESNINEPIPDESIINEPIVNKLITERIHGIDLTVMTKADHVIVSGINNIVHIQNTDVLTIDVSGINNIVYYPIGSDPQILDHGIDNQILIK